jgi:hypothetical protein
MGVVASGQVRYRPTENGPWRPWSFTAIASARQARGATAEEVKGWQARLQELGAIVKRAPAVVQPVGFAAEIWGNLDGYGPPTSGEPAGAKVPLAGSLSFGAFPLIEFMRNGKLANEDMKGGETQLLLFTVNHIDRGIFSGTIPMEWSGEEAPGFVAPKVGATVAGDLQWMDDVLVLVSEKNAGRPLWLPLTLGEALKPVVAQRRGIYENRRTNLEKQRREFAEWQTEAKRAERSAGWKQAAAMMGAEEGGKFLANMEKSDVEIEAWKRKQLAAGGPEEKDVQEAERQLKEAENLVGGTAAACYDRTANGLAGRFRALAGAPRSCEPLVKTNWAFFDATRPRTAPQVLMVTMYARCVTKESLARGEETRGGCAINRKLMETLDWEAVKEWMRR